MKTTRFPGLVFAAFAMFALPAAAQTPGKTTPASEPMCDTLVDATPGLYGLCVAMCEAQHCVAEYNPFTQQVDFDSSCSPSSDQLLANYMKLADPSKDPPLPPCVQIPCSCWTEAEIDKIGGSQSGSVTNDFCFLGDSFSGLFNGLESAYTLYDEAHGFMCVMTETNPPTERTQYNLSTTEFNVCQQSVRDECASRGIQ